MALLKLLFKNKLIIIITLIIIILVVLFYKEVPTLIEPNYIICFPKGGFINMIHRIIACHRYAKNYNRVLIIDTRKNWFADSLNEYMFFHSNNVYVGDNDFLYNSLQPLAMYPENLPLKTLGEDALRKCNTSLNRDYQERVLLYSNFGGGSSAKEFFSLCSLTPMVFNAYKSARERLPPSYVAVHIRSRSDVAAFIKKHADLLNGRPVFLASDNKDTIELFKKKFNIYSFSDIHNNEEHDDLVRNKEEIRKYNIDTIVDLLLLASGSELYYSCAESAYTQAAIELHQDTVLTKRLTTQKIDIT